MTKAQAALERVGIPVYVNSATRLEKDGYALWLAGLGDQLALLPSPAAGRTRVEGIDDIEATLGAVPEGEVVILMAHEPDVFVSPDPRVALTLSGHTHGGQISLLGWRPWAASRGSRRFPLGHFQSEGRDLVVSGGLGCSVVPVRLGSWPEIVLLELGDA